MGMTFSEHVAAIALGLLPGDELPDVATAALVDGYESPSLAALAGQSSTRYDPVECRRLWDMALGELRLVPTVIDAGKTMVLLYARLVTTGELEPHEGASRVIGTDSIGAGIIIDLLYEYERNDYWGDESTDRRIDADVLRECERIVSEAASYQSGSCHISGDSK